MSEPVTWKPRSFSIPATGAMAEPGDSEEVDVFGVCFCARQITSPQREGQKRRPEASGTKSNVKSARNTSASRKSSRAGWLQNFELAFAIGR